MGEGHRSSSIPLSVGRLEDQPRALEAFAYGLAPPAGYHAHDPIALTGEVLERLGQLSAVQNEDHPVLLRELLNGLASRLFCPHGLSQQTLPLGRLGPQPASARVSLGLEGGLPLAPVLHVLLDPVQHPLNGGHAMLAHHQPPLSVCPSTTHSTLVSPIVLLGPSSPRATREDRACTQITRSSRPSFLRERHGHSGGTFGVGRAVRGQQHLAFEHAHAFLFLSSLVGIPSIVFRPRTT